MHSIVSVNPFRCRMWDLHDRLEANVTEESCRAEIASFSKHGQLVPVLGRPLQNDPAHDVELIYGARRLFVARHLNKPLAVELRPMSDREAIVAMDIENRQRVDISPYERGLSYARWLRSGYFASQEDLAKAIKSSPSVVSRLLKLAKLPPVIVDAFRDPTEICEAWGLDILSALEDAQRRPHTVREARAIAAMPVKSPSREVYKRLVAASAPGRKLRPQHHDEVVKGRNGLPLFRIRQQSSSVVFMLPLEKISAPVLQHIRESLSEILQGEVLLERHGPEPQHSSKRGSMYSGHARMQLENGRLEPVS